MYGCSSPDDQPYETKDKTSREIASSLDAVIFNVCQKREATMFREAGLRFFRGIRS